MLMTLMERWFVPGSPSADYRAADYVLLFLILATGVFLRFWGLGNVGLHGDEETMAMPAMAILETGDPYLPSGMYYARALLNIYMMSASAFIFGESAWAFRLPSAIVGSLTGVAAFFMGRRFLAPQFNLAFVATMTLLPSMIVVSQTARMYVFFVTCIIWFAACLFRWERDQRLSSLVLALLVWCLALHFHTLSMFAALLFLFPGLSRRSWPLLIQGAAALLVGGLLYKVYSTWISNKYPGESEKPPPLEEETGEASPLEFLASEHQWLLILGAIVVGALTMLLLLRVARRFGWPRVMPVLLVGAGLLAMVLLHYHVGGLLLLLGIVFWFRAPDLPRSWLFAAVALAAVMAVAHLAFLYSTGLYPGRKVIGAMIGLPSVWPILRFLVFSPFAGVVYALVLVFAFWRFSRGNALPSHFLYFVMAVWIPLLVIGIFLWWIPPRYAQGQLGFFLMCTFAGMAYVARELKWLSADARLSAVQGVALVLLSAAMINPVALARTVNPGYDMYPDHEGAARFIKGLELDPSAVLIAEDVLQQTYYLGQVDYWLREIDNAHGYAVVQDGRLVDQYTATPVLGTGEALLRVLEQNPDRDVYIIGTGENFTDGRQIFRGRGIAEVLESDRLEVVYEGRDGKTRVWRRVQ